MKKYLMGMFVFTMIIFITPIIIVNFWKNDIQELQEEIIEKIEEPLKTVKVYFFERDQTEEVDFSEYLKGVVAAEMPASFNYEALKAQAVAARTYIVERVKSNNTQHKDGAPICNDSAHCKAWISKEKAIENWGGQQEYWNKISQSVEDTVGEVIIYDGQPIQAVFHSTSSGRTEKAADVWGNDLPYLQGVESPGDEQSPRFNSIERIDIEEVKNKLELENVTIGEILKTEAGGVKEIEIGGKKFNGNQIRNIFSLKSTHFEISIEGNEMVFNVTGSGHGVGMSQYGANYLAGLGKSYDEILKTYYNNVEINNFIE